MIVIVLLGLLSVLGVVFYNFASQERSNAEYYADGAKVVEAPGLTADELMDHALEQLIVGPKPTYKNSVLWGKRHSLVGNTVGVKDLALTDLTAYNGQGVLLAQSGGAPFVDQNQDGTADAGQLLDSAGQQVRTSNNGSNIQDLVGMVDSPAANQLFERNTGRLPQPDVGYTYPDNNNAFLAYNGWIRERTTGRIRRVIIPSFHRPQQYRDAGGAPIPLWEDANYNNSTGDSIVLSTTTIDEDIKVNGALDAGSTNENEQFRAHPNHVYVPPGNRSGATVSRYIRTASEAAALLGDGKRVFPFLPMYTGYRPVDNAGSVDLQNRPPDWIGHQGIWSGPHPVDSSYATPSLAVHDEYQYDVDNDGDGINEGVWIDLDFPVQELADGTLFIPMFSFTVYDLDGLINLNTHGNIQNLLFTTMPFNNGSAQFGVNPLTGSLDFISASHLGMHAGEVNPAWALTGRPGIDSSTAMSTVFDQYRRFFGNLPVDSSTLTGNEQTRLSSFQETANMDLAYLKFGRPEVSGSTIDQIYPGLYGEEHLISRYFSAGANNALNFPHPGTTTSDDNGDINEGMEFNPQYRSTPAVSWLDVDQPRDTTGIGSIFASNNPKSVDRVNPASGGSRLRWLRYTGYASNGRVQWGQTSLQTGGLMQSSQAYGLYDDSSEVALYAEDQRDVDDPFTADDAAFLAMSNNDLNTLGIKSRMSDLASFNFATSNSTNARGEEIRKKFTTVSNDRKNYSLTRNIGNTGRIWEWNDDQGRTAANSTEKLRFPPVFGPTNSVITRYSATDPFRSPVRYLLQSTQEDLQVKQYQQRLSVNQVLVFDWQTQNSTELVYRDLTMHPTDPGNTPIPTTQPTYQGSYPWGNAANQEYWARRDRQMLARDIYVLLYVLGGPLDGDASNNPLVTTGTTHYTEEQLEQMARFAVNLVDAQDKDRVITKFEYDADLSNGWNLDDNPYTTDTSGDRREIYGVEKQEFAINEFLAFQTAQEMADVTPHTHHNDENERQFLCIELRNMAPYDIQFNDTAEWQIVLRQLEPGDAGYNADLERQLTLKSGSGTATAGNFFTIFTSDRNDDVNPWHATNNPAPSAFRVDPTGSAGLQWIMPRDAAFASPNTASGDHIDLVAAIAASPSTPPLEIRDGNGADLIATANGNEGAFLMNGSLGNFVLNTTLRTDIILRRRAHPTRARPTVGSNPQEQDNPWVEVDRATIPATQMPNFNYPDMGNDAQAQLQQLKSFQRAEPLVRGATTPQPSTGNQANTFSSGVAAENQNAPTPVFRVHHNHFDRRFNSLAELFEVPIVGPPNGGATSTRTDGLTTYLSTMRESPQLQYSHADSASSHLEHYGKSAGHMFLMPDHPTQGTVGGVDQNWDNRWYRVLEFLEIPTRQNRELGIGTDFQITRVPGKINLNMLRDPEVLAALIDDERIFDYTTGNTDIRYPQFVNKTDGTTNWYEELQNSRDPQDPYWNSQGQDLRLPGTPRSTGATYAAHPFRSLSHVGTGTDNPLQHTLLRSLPADASQTSKRQLFEVGNWAEHSDPANQLTAPDMMLRHQVLSKIWNNTTVRSNSFAVFVSVKLFRAATDPVSGAVRIGGPLKEFSTGVEERPELPEYRGAFIVDRSLLEKGVSTSGGGFTNFRPFVTYRRILREE